MNDVFDNLDNLERSSPTGDSGKKKIGRLVVRDGGYQTTPDKKFLAKKKPCFIRAFFINLVLPRGFEPLLPP